MLPTETDSEEPRAPSLNDLESGRDPARTPHEARAEVDELVEDGDLAFLESDVLGAFVAEHAAVDGRPLEFRSLDSVDGTGLYLVRLCDDAPLRKGLRSIFRTLNDVLAGDEKLSTETLLELWDAAKSALGGNPLPPGERLTPGRVGEISALVDVEGESS